MTKVKRVIRPVLKEFRTDKCGFNHIAPDDFVKSQWQTRTKSITYLIYRWLISIFFIAVVIYSMVTGMHYGMYFIYLTNWGIMMCMLTNALGAILVSIWYLHPEFADRVVDSNAMPISFKIYWAMHITTLIVSIVITIVYWSILYNDRVNLDAVNILTHAFNAIMMFTDLWIVAYPVRLLHIFAPVLFGITYVIFSAIYYAAGGVNPDGNNYIYEVLKWSEPGQAMITVVGVLLLCCVLYIIIFFLYKLRLFIYHRCNRKKMFIPTSYRMSSPPVTVPPNGISMVFGQDNQGFSGSTDKIPN